MRWNTVLCARRVLTSVRAVQMDSGLIRKRMSALTRHAQLMAAQVVRYWGPTSVTNVRQAYF